MDFYGLGLGRVRASKTSKHDAEVNKDEVKTCLEMLAGDTNMANLMLEVADAVDVMARQPILTIGKLTLDNIVYHRMMGEYRTFLRVSC